MPRILSLDVGEKRIGVAISDELHITAQGLETIQQKGKEHTLGTIRDLVEKHDVNKIIVGMPLNMNGTKGQRAKATESFISALKKKFTIPIETIDERLSTAQGERLLIEADVSRKKRKASLDKIAAQLILQTYLDSKA